MSQHGHTVVWIDHRIAKIFEFNRKDVDRNIVHHWHAAQKIHHKAGSIGSSHVPEDDTYLREVANALSASSEILIIGPSHVKWELRSYLNLHAPRISQQIMAVVDADHTSDRQIVDHARKYFSRIDHMTPQTLTQNR